MRAGSLGGYIARARIDELLKTAGEFAVLPAYFLAPQAASAAYLEKLRARAERLRGGLVDALELDLAKSLASEDLGAEERSRRLVAGLRELEAAFGGE